MEEKGWQRLGYLCSRARASRSSVHPRRPCTGRDTWRASSGTEAEARGAASLCAVRVQGACARDRASGGGGVWRPGRMRPGVRVGVGLRLLARRWWAARLGQQARVLVGRWGARRAGGARGGGSVGLLRWLGQAGHARASRPEARGAGLGLVRLLGPDAPFLFSSVFFSFSISYFYPTLCHGFLTLEYMGCQHVYLLGLICAYPHVLTTCLLIVVVY